MARDAGARAASRLPVRDQRATALVAANDLSRWLATTDSRDGTAVPGDLSVTGYK